MVEWLKGRKERGERREEKIESRKEKEKRRKEKGESMYHGMKPPVIDHHINRVAF